MRPWATVLGVLLLPGVAWAQGTVPGWSGLAATGLSTVYVRDDAGVETSGRLLRVNPDSLVLLVNSAEVRIETARVSRIERRGDSLRNGALVGAIVGVAMGALTAAMSDCPGDDPGGSCPGVRAGAFLASVGVYAGIGTGIDAMVVGRTTLYEAQASRPSSQPAGRRAAIRLSVGW